MDKPTRGRVTPIRPLDPDLRRVLAYLEAEAWTGRGWWRRGVRGWRLEPEIETALKGRVRKELVALDEQGYVSRVRVEDPGQPHPLHLCRITRTGARRLAATVGAPMMSLPEPLPDGEDPDACAIFVPRDRWLTLDLLRRFAADKLGPARWEQWGWMRTGEMRARLGGTIGSDMPWLLSRGLVERRAGEAVKRIRPTWYYRATAYALDFEMIDAIPSGAGLPRFVQLRPRSAPGPN